jgi:hypothetical protein
MANVLAVAKSVIQATPGHELLEKYGPLLRTGIDKAFKRAGKLPIQGEAYFVKSSESKGYKKFQGKVGTGLMKQSRDNDLLPKIEGGLGFDYEISTVGYRASIDIERELLEKEQYGMVGQEQRDLADASKRTIELLCADVFNRGFGGVAYGDPYNAAGLAPFVCEDGAYLISTARNNALGGVAAWSNRMPDIAFTAGGNNEAILADLIRDVKLRLRQYVNDSGILSPMTLKRIIVSPVLEDLISRVTSTMKVYAGDTTNLAGQFSEEATNTVAGTKFEVYDWLSDGLIYFEAMGENELEMLWRVKPGIMTYTLGNPDMLSQRIRMSLGFGCPRPSTFIGCSATGTANL